MCVSLDWGDEKQTYTIFKFEGEWTWQDLHHQITRFLEVLPADYPPIPCIVDMRKSNYLPRDVIMHSQLLMKYSHDPRVGKLALVGGTRLLVMVHGILIKLGNTLAQNLIFIETMDEAVAYASGLAKRYDNEQKYLA